MWFLKDPNTIPSFPQIRPDDSTSDDSSQTLRNPSTNPINPSNLYPSGSYSLKRLHSYPSGSDTDTSPPQPPRPMGKPPVPERNSELLSKVANKRTPPAPPPRTSSRSPLASPTSPSLPSKIEILSEQAAHINAQLQQQQKMDPSQDGVQRQMALELRHQELLKKQKVLQDQYSRLQEMSKTSGIMQGLEHDQGPDDGMADMDGEQERHSHRSGGINNNNNSNNTITNKIYETEIL